MRDIDWDEHRAHRNQVITDKGQWVGLCDEDGIPYLDLPDLDDMDWPEARGSTEDVSVTMRVRTPRGRLHRVVSELVAENLGRVDQVGKLIPVTGPPRFLALERGGLGRRVMLISHVEVEGDALLPHTMTIHGADLLILLDLLVCPSNPVSWAGEFTRFTRDWVGPEELTETFQHPRDLADIKMFTVADGASVEGPTDEVITRLIRESLDAIYRMAQVELEPYNVVMLESLVEMEGPPPEPVYESVTIDHRSYRWDKLIEGTAGLLADGVVGYYGTIRKTSIQFSEPVTCDRDVETRTGGIVRILAGNPIPANQAISPVQIGAVLGHFTFTAVAHAPLSTSSPYTIIRPTDQTIWAEVGEIALGNGVGLRAQMWWPGDPPVGELTPSHQQIIFTVRQEV